MAHDSKEANRARQQRHRDKVRAVTLATIGGEVAAKLQQQVHCIKCSNLTRQHGNPVVCPDCQRVRDEGLRDQNLTETRASTTHAGKIVTGGYTATKAERDLAANERGQHGHSGTYQWNRGSDDKDDGADWKPVKVGRYTGRVGTKDVLQQCAEACVQSDQEQRKGQPRDPKAGMVRVWWEHMRYTLAAATLRKQFPKLSPDKFFYILWESAEGKAAWKRLSAGAPVKDGTQRCESLDDLLHKGV